MDSILKTKKINSPLGILFQIPVFLISAFGLLQLAYIFYLSLTDFNGMEKPNFRWFQNYAQIFKDELVLEGLGNTVVMVLLVSLLLFVTAILPALFISKLKLRFGIIVLGAFSLISLAVILPNFLNEFLEVELYRMFLENSSNEAIPITESHARLVSIIIMWLYCLAPVFAIAFIAAKLKHNFKGVAASLCAIPILMYLSGGRLAGVLNFQHEKPSFEWLYTVYKDYFEIRWYIGYSCAILFVGLAMFICWCTIVCSATFGSFCLSKKLKISSTAQKWGRGISLSLAGILFLTVLVYLMIYLLKSIMTTDEFEIYPYIYAPMNPTLQNFTELFKGYSEFMPFSRYIYNSLVAVPLMIMPVCVFVALPCGVGFSLFKSPKKEKLLLLCLLPFLSASFYIALSRLGLVDTYFAYAFEFLSSVEFFVALFLVYIAVKLVFSGGKTTVGRILLGSFSLLTSFYAIAAIRGIWYRSDLIYSQELMIWSNSVITNKQIDGWVVAAANDMLMLIATIAVIIPPIILFVNLYLSYRKSTINTLEA